MTQPTLYLMFGYPGAGKTTAAEIIARLSGAVHLASDRMRLEMFPRPQFNPAEHKALYKAINDKTEKLLSEGKSAVYDANLNRYEHREEKYQICQRTNAKPLLIWVQVDKQLAKARAIHDQRHHLVPPHEKPEDMFERIVSILEPPRVDEPTIELNGRHITEDYIKQALKL